MFGVKEQDPTVFSLKFILKKKLSTYFMQREEPQRLIDF